MKFITLITYITYLLMCVYIPVYKLPRLEVILFLRFEANVHFCTCIKQLKIYFDESRRNFIKFWWDPPL
jgi:hypothetical protein